jgi:ABC-type Fe3+/spermidine/putrescine transport system ATPase subunit
VHDAGKSVGQKTQPLLKLERVSKSFGVRQVVDALDLEVHPGELLCVLGASGCGKTTLLRMIAGLETPDQGVVAIRGSMVFGNGKTSIPPQRRGIGFVFQDLALWPHLTVAGNLDFVLASRGVPKTERGVKIRQTLNLVRLSNFEKAHAETLSGGEQQRLAIARALVGNPSLLLLDEPLSSLDYRLKVELQQELLLWLRDLKMTALLITHDQTEAIAMADRLAIMHQGHIVQVGTPKEVRENPADDFVRHFLIN